MLELGRDAPGRLVPVSGANGELRAYLPEPLPPRWSWPDSLWPLLLEARVALARTDGAARYFDPDGVLLPGLAGCEAHATAALEGSVADPLEQLLFEIDPPLPVPEDDPTVDFRTVFACKRALESRAEAKAPLARTTQRVESALHAHLGPPRAPRSAPRESGPLRGLPPPPEDQIPDVREALERFIDGDRRHDPLVDALLVHYQLVAIHAGWGSGIAARLALAELVAAWCELAPGWLFLSPSFARRSAEYAGRLARVATHGEWTEWVELGLRATLDAARDAARRLERLRVMRRSFHGRLARARLGPRLGQVLDGLFAAPVVRIVRLAERHRVAYPTAKSDVERLAGLGILEELRGTPLKTFYAPRILHVCYDDLDPDDLTDLTLA